MSVKVSILVYTAPAPAANLLFDKWKTVYTYIKL